MKLQRKHRVAWVPGWPAMAVLALTAACDVSVNNPGPVEDAFLAERAAHAGVVNGAGRDLAEAINWTAYTGAAVARELHPAGSTGSFGITPQQQVGILRPDQVNTHWELAQRARWTAEDGARRVEEALGADFGKSEVAAQLLLWAGYANRHLGENFCQAVINGGAPQPHTEYFKRAEEQFTRAMAIAQAASKPDLATAARAGRASVRAYLGNWAGAVEDASGVPTGFKFVMPYYATELNLYNRIHEASRSTPYRAHTVWNTVYEQYYLETKDPRTPWGEDPKNPVGDAAVLDLGRVPWYFQLKYPQRNSPINLSTGREMRLIEAEAMLRNGDWQGAMQIINELRTTAKAPPVEAASLTEAWTRLKRERGIELWLEARRLGDLRRWDESNTPGELDPLETPGPQSNLIEQSLCFPISEAEAQTNPNIPAS